jgi:hypothetical protein
MPRTCYVAGLCHSAAPQQQSTDGTASEMIKKHGERRCEACFRRWMGVSSTRCAERTTAHAQAATRSLLGRCPVGVENAGPVGLLRDHPSHLQTRASGTERLSGDAYVQRPPALDALVAAWPYHLRQRLVCSASWWLINSVFAKRHIS